MSDNDQNCSDMAVSFREHLYSAVLWLVLYGMRLGIRMVYSTSFQPISMWKNYIRTAFRNSVKNKVYSAINLIGLSIGVAAGILIFLFLQQEISFDNFHTQEEDIYRLTRMEKWEGDDDGQSASTPLILLPSVKDNVNNIKYATRLIEGNYLAKREGEKGFSQIGHLVSPDFFQLFQFPILEGAGFTEGELKSIVLTQEASQRYFGNKSPLGETLLIQLDDEFISFTVKGVIENPPINSSLQFEMLLSDENIDAIYSENARRSWFQVYGETYIMLEPNTNLQSTKDQLQTMVNTALGERINEVDYRIVPQALSTIHLDTDVSPSVALVTNPRLLYILGAVALLIILIASINFTTMAIGRSVSRAKEVGVRKSMGAGFGQLFLQFITESFMITLIALLFGMIAAELFLPTFNKLLANELVLSYSTYQVGVIVIIAFTIALLSGAYPAVFLSRLHPIAILKGGNFKFGKENLRRGLLAFQFFISISLISCTLIMYLQMEKVRDHDLGIAKDSILQIIIPPTPSIRGGFEYAQLVKTALLNHEAVSQVGVATSVFGDNSWIEAGFESDDKKTILFNMNMVDEDYIDVMGLKILEGRNFAADNPSDLNASFILNEAMADLLQWENPIGMTLPGKGFGENRAIGVVKDFHYESLYNQIDPAIMVMNHQNIFEGLNHVLINADLRQTIFVKYRTQDLQATLASFEDIWKGIHGTDPFEYSFFDETIAQTYVQDSRLSRLITIAAIIAVVISAMGLFALASLSIASRVKEIGIRKVLGANISEISMMFNLEFLKIIALGMILSIPISYLVMSQWLQQFAVKETIGAGVFLMAIAIGCIFSIVIVSYKTIQTALADPVKSLRSE